MFKPTSAVRLSSNQNHPTANIASGLERSGRVLGKPTRGTNAVPWTDINQDPARIATQADFSNTPALPSTNTRAPIHSQGKAFPVMGRVQQLLDGSAAPYESGVAQLTSTGNGRLFALDQAPMADESFQVAILGGLRRGASGLMKGAQSPTLRRIGDLNRAIPKLEKKINEIKAELKHVEAEITAANQKWSATSKELSVWEDKPHGTRGATKKKKELRKQLDDALEASRVAKERYTEVSRNLKRRELDLDRLKNDRDEFIRRYRFEQSHPTGIWR